MSDTFINDGIYEVLRENTNSGKKSDRTSFIEKDFTFDTTGCTDLSFHVNAYYSGNQSDQAGDDEKFIFQYLDESTSSWVNIVDISPTDNTDDDVYHIFIGVPLTSITTTVRVVSEI